MEEFVATPGDIVIGPATYAAIKNSYRVAQLGFFALKGLSAQVPLYKIVGVLEGEETSGACRSRSSLPRRGRRKGLT